MAQAVTNELKDATLAGLAELKDRGLTQDQVALMVGVSQQAISAANKGGSVGLKTARGVAKALETTLDGLIRRYDKGARKPVRAGDIIGWQKAVAAARNRWPEAAPEWAYQLAGAVEIPAAPDEATEQLAADLAQLLTRHCAASAVREKPKKRA